MPTIINNPPSESGSGVGLAVGILVTVVVVIFLIFYGLPLIRGNQNPGTNINVQLPEVNQGGSQDGATQP